MFEKKETTNISLQAKKRILLEKAKQHQLTYEEALELKKLIEDDKDIDELLKSLIVFGLGALTGYLLTKK